MSTTIINAPLGFVGFLATRSQEQARRNAMTACTSLAARRLERLEVEEFVVEHVRRHRAATAADTASAIAQHHTETSAAAAAADQIRKVG